MISTRQAASRPASQAPLQTDGALSDAARRGDPSPSAGPSGRRGDGALWAACAALGATALVCAVARERLGDSEMLPPLVFFVGLSLLAVLVPASGPRGRRVGLIAGAGLAAVLLLPPWTATLPPLLANTLFAFSRDTAAARRAVLMRGLWLAAAALAGGALLTGLRHLGHWGLAASVLPAATVYGVLYVGGRQVGLRRGRGRRSAARQRAWAGWRLEAAGLLACAPAAVGMALLYPLLGVGGLAALAVLMGLLLVVAHLGFDAGALRDQVRAMEKLSALTVSQANPYRVADRFLRLGTGLLSCDRATLWLMDDSHTRLERAAYLHTGAMQRFSPGSDEQTVRFGEGLVGRVAERRAALIVRDGARDPRATEAERLGRSGTALLLLPLAAGGETVGVVRFERDAPGGFLQRDVTRVRALCIQASATLANVRMHQDIYSQAVTDGLTGLYNRRHLQTVLSDEGRRAVRYGHDLSVILLDVDGFKGYNDTYGHPQGDVLLKKMAALLRESVRGVDVVGRYGGEEFIIVMPETAPEDAWQTAERLRRNVAAAPFPGHAHEPEATVSRTISLGVATLPRDAADMQTLVSRADQALYRAKRGGRNRTVTAGAPPPSAPATDEPAPDEA